MTKLLEQAFEAARRLPPEAQDDIARAVLHLTSGSQEPEPLDPVDLNAVLDGLEQARRGEFASEAEIAAAFHRFGR